MSTLWAFPGQGAQQPGMLHGLPDAPAVRACLEEAGAVLGEQVLALDSAEALRETRAVQLCLLIAGVACARLLIQRGHRPDYVAGLSIGAYAAAVIAESLDFADALRLVALRGELMQRAYPSGYGMSAILGLDQRTLEGLLGEAEGPVYPGQYQCGRPAGNRRQPRRPGGRGRASAGNRCGRGQAAGGQRTFALRVAGGGGRAVGRGVRRYPPASAERALSEQQFGASAYGYWQVA